MLNICWKYSCIFTKQTTNISHISIGKSSKSVHPDDWLCKRANGWIFWICSDDPGINDAKTKCNVSFGDNETFCSCSCRDFRRTRLLCKHFFAIIESGRKQFSDLKILFLNHTFNNFDKDLFEDNEIDNVPDPTLINDKCKKCEEKIEEEHVPDLMDSSDFENAIGKNSFWVFFNKLFY